jgi:hypothetical protein
VSSLEQAAVLVVSLKECRQDLLSHTIHETLDAYDTLKLRKASASEAEQEQGKHFVKDLGVSR